MINFLKRFTPILVFAVLATVWILFRNWGESIRFFLIDNDFHKLERTLYFASYSLSYMPFGLDILGYFIVLAIGGFFILPWGICLILAAIIMPSLNLVSLFTEKETLSTSKSLLIFAYIRYVYVGLVMLIYHNSIWPDENPILNFISITFLGILFILGLIAPIYCPDEIDNINNRLY